jgi:hypothetical protein
LEPPWGADLDQQTPCVLCALLSAVFALRPTLAHPLAYPYLVESVFAEKSHQLTELRCARNAILRCAVLPACPLSCLPPPTGLFPWSDRYPRCW